MLRRLFNFCSNIQIKGSKLQNINLRQSKMALCSVNNSVVSDSVTPWTIACQAPLAMEFSRQESVQFSHSVMFNSLWSHELLHPRLQFSSPTLGDCSNLCPLSRWCHPTILSSFIPFSSYLHSFPASGSFLMSQFFISGGQVLELHLQHQSFHWIFRIDFL